MMRQCAAELCKRPATWHVLFWHGSPSPSKSAGGVWCKAHAEEEMLRLKAEMTDEERNHRFKVRAQRDIAIGKLSDILHEIERMYRQINDLEGGYARQVPDPAFAAHLRAVIAVFGDVLLLKNIVETLRIMAGQNFPPIPAEQEEAIAPEGVTS